MPEPSKPLVMGAGPQLPLPHPRDFLAALAILTPLPVRAPAPASERFARASMFFPLVGALVGVFSVIVNHTLPTRLGDPATSCIIVLAWSALSLPTVLTNRHRAIQTILVAGKLLLLPFVTGRRDLALLFAPLLGSWAMVVLSIGARSAEEPGRKFNSAIAFREFGWTSVYTGAILAEIADALGIIVFVLAATVVLLMRLALHRWCGGVNWSSLCVSAHIVEVLLLAGFVLL